MQQLKFEKLSSFLHGIAALSCNHHDVKNKMATLDPSKQSVANLNRFRSHLDKLNQTKALGGLDQTVLCATISNLEHFLRIDKGYSVIDDDAMKCVLFECTRTLHICLILMK